MKKAVMYGAGNIGRGFIGQLFSESGYEVVFIDVNKEIVNQLNTDRCYPIRIVSENNPREVIVQNVRAVDGMNKDAVAQEIAGADIMATAVGVNILPRIVKPIVSGLRKRWETGNFVPLNMIICENLMDANHYLAGLIGSELEQEEKKLFEQYVGLVEASIGRMVPVMAPEMQEGNILRVCVEEYCQLPVDKEGFKGEIPGIRNMNPFSPFSYYIQRKLYIHNMGHAVTAYLGFLKGYKYIWEAIRDEQIRAIAANAMKESARALSMEHGVPLDVIMEHVEDLINRFGNKYLGDTIERVGKDPIRKISPNDRLVGALNLCSKQGVKSPHITVGIAAALCFNLENDSAAVQIQNMMAVNGMGEVLGNICGLQEGTPEWKQINRFHRLLKKEANLKGIIIELEMLKEMNE